MFGFARTICAPAVNNCIKHILPRFSREQQCFRSRILLKAPVANVQHSVPWIPPLEEIPPHQEEIIDTTREDDEKIEEVTQKINELTATGETGRLFAVVYVCGKQFKVTENDIIVIRGYWPPNPGDQLIMEKVMLVGGMDFTLVGRPVLSREVVRVDATVLEKTFSSTVTRFRMRPRKQFKNTSLYRVPHTMVRINTIKIRGKIDEKKEVEGLDKVF